MLCYVYVRKPSKYLMFSMLLPVQLTVEAWLTLELSYSVLYLVVEMSLFLQPIRLLYHNTLKGRWWCALLNPRHSSPNTPMQPTAIRTLFNIDKAYQKRLIKHYRIFEAIQDKIHNRIRLTLTRYQEIIQRSKRLPNTHTWLLNLFSRLHTSVNRCLWISLAIVQASPQVSPIGWCRRTLHLVGLCIELYYYIRGTIVQWVYVYYIEYNRVKIWLVSLYAGQVFQYNNFYWLNNNQCYYCTTPSGSYMS